MPHPAIRPDAVAVVTGGASGIGLAAARRLAEAGMRVVIADLRTDRLEAAAETLRAAGAPEVRARAVDVSDRAALAALEEEITAEMGGADLLMNNAGIQPGSALFGDVAVWEKVLATNLWGVIHGTQLFGPGMIARGRPGAIINTGSKQGITTPPGDPAYNVSKAGVKVFTEALAHELRNTEGCRITAHLFIPGFVFTDLNRRGRSEKPAGAWTPEQTVDFMLAALERGDFYILCPDNEVSREVDARRIAWAAGDIIENRPALSRWHPDWAEAFSRYMKGE
ncbi:MAG: SDR family NAD(P)-dependent oxidoreductase [Alphaproteobacteria bacterium]|nr:MAG: SDR family NAD(P)-dependent oxidoreductase [Alphaproteobacteria bacterium]